MHTVRSSRSDTRAPCVRKFGTLVIMMVVHCLPRSLGRCWFRGSPRGLPCRPPQPSCPDSPLPWGVGTDAEVSTPVLWSDPDCMSGISSDCSSVESLQVLLCWRLLPTNLTLPWGSCAISTPFAAMGMPLLIHPPAPTMSPLSMPCTSEPPLTMLAKSISAVDDTSSGAWAKRQVAPCLQRPLAANLQSLVLKNPTVVLSSRSSCA
mmetsp:Transcript_38466/g.111156  ORF Transcript_38466/g.111156 Transcript_38466/m.111156 type:complete len:206 (+) Transcript_38466:469-1086(+)